MAEDTSKDTAVDTIDVETALITALTTQDVGPATEPIDLDRLSSTEKQVVLQLLRSRIGYVDNDADLSGESLS